ncbi:flagellar basal-body rod protein FlgF [Sphingomonas oligophenolica]|uniref:Flagellar hook basal-body protein n=1 Tax=Sphingomonas oligophenolica TaxID=301154 RepID=A0ABU9Y3Z0_9SPHN
MSGLVESAVAILSASEKRLEVVSSNISNVSTAGYKRQISFADLVANGGADGVGAVLTRTRADLAQGKLNATGNPLDLAISGDGFFQLRDGTDAVYSRQGQFKLAADGTVVNQQGFALQQAGGGDLALDRANVKILADGTILDGTRPVGRVGLFAPSSAAAVQPLDGSMFRFTDGAANEVSDPQLRQGMTETSNVSVGDEMVTMMASLRQAESGSRLMQTYDDLLGRAITTFGAGGR